MVYCRSTSSGIDVSPCRMRYLGGTCVCFTFHLHHRPCLSPMRRRDGRGHRMHSRTQTFVTNSGNKDEKVEISDRWRSPLQVSSSTSKYLGCTTFFAFQESPDSFLFSLLVPLVTFNLLSVLSLSPPPFVQELHLSPKVQQLTLHTQEQQQQHSSHCICSP